MPAQRVARLDERVRDDAMKRDAFVKTFARELFEILDRLRRVVFVKLDDHAPEMLFAIDLDVHDGDLIGGGDAREGEKESEAVKKMFHGKITRSRNERQIFDFDF